MKALLEDNVIIHRASAPTLLLATIQDPSLNTHHLINSASSTDGQNNIQIFIAHLCRADYTLAIQIHPAHGPFLKMCLFGWDALLSGTDNKATRSNLEEQSAHLAKVTGCVCSCPGSVRTMAPNALDSAGNEVPSWLVAVACVNHHGMHHCPLVPNTVYLQGNKGFGGLWLLPRDCKIDWAVKRTK